MPFVFNLSSYTRILRISVQQIFLQGGVIKNVSIEVDYVWRKIKKSKKERGKELKAEKSANMVWKACLPIGWKGVKKVTDLYDQPLLVNSARN